MKKKIVAKRSLQRNQSTIVIYLCAIHTSLTVEKKKKKKTNRVCLKKKTES